MRDHQVLGDICPWSHSKATNSRWRDKTQKKNVETAKKQDAEDSTQGGQEGAKGNIGNLHTISCAMQ